jgi:hypothetical protein
MTFPPEAKSCSAAIRWIIFVVFSVYCCACAHATNGDPAKIRGQVVYEPTGQPLKDVVVKLLRPHREFLTLLKNLGQEAVPDLLAVTKTDSNGRFYFETSARGPYEITCFRGGGHSGSGLLNVDPKKFALIRYKADPKPEIWHRKTKR